MAPHRRRPSNSMQLVPYAHRHLAVVPPLTIASARLSIPRGWGVEEVPRRDGSHTDRYYYEPGTGRKFRSIREVHRYLYPSTSTRTSTRNHSSEYGRMLVYGPTKRGLRRMIVSRGKLLKLDNELRPSDSARVDAPPAPDILPDGWMVEEVPRRYDKYWIDKYYYEPETGQKFRSLAAVERYLAGNTPLSKALEEIEENKPLSKIFKLENHTKNSTPRNKNSSRENAESSSFLGPPMKVNWVLASPQGDVWNPFITEASVPDSVQQQWNNRFMLFMNNNDETNNIPSS